MAKESRRLYQITDSCWKGNTGSAGWTGSWTARSKHRRVYKAVQRKNRRSGRSDHPCCHHSLRGQKLQLHHKDSAGSSSDQEGLQY